jgi:hypothetical protein
MLRPAFAVAVIGTALGFALPASAASITVSKTDSNFGVSATRPIFENFDSIGAGYAPVAEQATGPALVDPSGGPANVGAFAYNSDLAIGRARRPGVTGGAGGNEFPGLSSGNFGAVGENGRYTINFADYAGIGPVLRSFSFSLGSISEGNMVTLISRTGNAANNIVLTGFGIVNNDTSLVGENYRVRFDAGKGADAGWTGAIFESSSVAFEFDNFAGAAPEPQSWAMLILGFGLAGAALRRARNLAVA